MDEGTADRKAHRFAVYENSEFHPANFRLPLQRGPANYDSPSLCFAGLGSAERDNLIRYYFIRGYSNLMIACFLCAIHGIVSISTVKQSLKRQNLRKTCSCCLSGVKKLKVLDFKQAELDGSGSSVQCIYLRLRV